MGNKINVISLIIVLWQFACNASEYNPYIYEGYDCQYAYEGSEYNPYIYDGYDHNDDSNYNDSYIYDSEIGILNHYSESYTDRYLVDPEIGLIQHFDRKLETAIVDVEIGTIYRNGRITIFDILR